MKLNIIADENIGGSVINALRTSGYSVVSIKEQFPGLSDQQIIDLAKETDSLIITEDNDFGKWTFHFRVKSKGIILLRIKYSDKDKIINNLLSVLQQYGSKLQNKFAVITAYKIRIRDF
ncbi:DUF5615 family PIN-like protein [bacterium]|nr:DUF5615 family PIN-like protein [bacterium]